MKRKVRRKIGDVVKIELGGGDLAFAQVLERPLFAFFDLKSTHVPPIEEIVSSQIAFSIWVMDHAVTSGNWPVIGSAPLRAHEPPKFYKQDPISGELSITYTGAEEVEATYRDCAKLECAAVWEPEHVVDRLRDHFAGRSNKWVVSLRPIKDIRHRLKGK